MPVTKYHIDKSVELAKIFGAKKLVLFGSSIDDPQNANDIDLAVDGIEGFQIFSFSDKLEKLINIPVDVIPMDVKSAFLDYILKYGRVIYES